MKKILFFILLLTALTIPAVVVWAQVVDESATVNADVVSSEATAVVKAPSAFGRLWFNVRERVSLALTFDPVKDAEKRLAYAEKRMNMATAIAESSDDPVVQAKAEVMIQRAQALTEKIATKKESWLNDKDQDKVKVLMEKITKYESKKQEIFDRLEEKVSPDNLEKLQELRQTGLEKSQRLMNVLSNENISEETKQKLEAIKTRVETRLKEVKQLNEQRKELREEQKPSIPRVASRQPSAPNTQSR